MAIQRVLFPSPWPAPDVPRRLDEAMAPLMRQEVRAEMTVVGTPEVRAGLSRIVDRLVAAVPEPLRPGAGPSPTIEVMVIRSPQINAFTLPGGLICVDTGLLRAVGSPQELAAVLSHEMSHVVHRDPLSLLAARLGMAALMSILGTRTGAAVIQNAIGELVSARYGRAAEDQADRFAVDLLASAGLDPESFAEALSRMREAGARTPALLKYLDPHSPIDERISRARDQAHRVKGGPASEAERPLDVDWQTLLAALPKE